MGSMTRPAKVVRIAPEQFRITLQEGRNRQVRRMVRKVGEHVTVLKRIRVANIRLDRLPEGQWRYLAEKEKNDLLGLILK